MNKRYRSCNQKSNKEAAMTKHFLDPAVLNQFTGSEHWFRHGLLLSITFTDGAKYIADQARAYWLLDEIVLAQCFDKNVAAEEF